MKLVDGRTDSIQKSGPNNDDSAVIRQMYSEGAKREEILRALPDIHADGIDNWIASLDREVEAAVKAAAEAKAKAEADAKAAAVEKVGAEKTSTVKVDPKGKPNPLS